jgi:hypothetical protein
MKVAIYGAGVSGLIAAWACEKRGVDRVDIFSDAIRKPEAFGFNYLHRPCDLEYIRYGLLSQSILQREIPADVCSNLYSLKLYGETGVVNSVGKLAEYGARKMIWNMEDAINFLWDKYQQVISISRIRDLEDLSSRSSDYDIVFSSIPLNKLCLDGGSFESAESFVTVFPTDSNNNEVFFDVDIESSICRYGTIWNKFFVESTKKLFIGSRKMLKVISYDGKIDLPENVHLIGRYGEWDKKILAHNVYESVLEIIGRM